MVDFGSVNDASDTLERSLEPDPPRGIPATLRATSEAPSAAFEKVSFTTSTASLNVERDSSPDSWEFSASNDEAASSTNVSGPECSAALSAWIASSTCSASSALRAGSSAVMDCSSSSWCLASASLEAHLRWKVRFVGLHDCRRADEETVANERGFERNELGWEVRSRKALRRKWNLGNS
jgi:hypothetical protein